MIAITPATTREELVAHLTRLQLALAGYTNQAGVQSFGYEEYSDDGGPARAALGYGDHAPGCAWPNGASGPEEWDDDLKMMMIRTYFPSLTCTCGLQARIAADMQALQEAV